MDTSLRINLRRSPVEILNEEKNEAQELWRGELGQRERLAPRGIEVEYDVFDRLGWSRHVFPAHYRLGSVLAEHWIAALNHNPGNVSIRLNSRLQANLSFKPSLLQDSRILRLDRHHDLAVYFRRVLGRDRGGTAENQAQQNCHNRERFMDAGNI
jgi:hypothetical protein